MTYNLDWSAPIEPGNSMLGLQLGMTFANVRALFEFDSTSESRATSFLNSPRLIVDSDKEGIIFLRAADMDNVVYDWQNILVRLIFDHGALKLMIVEFSKGDEAYRYQGKIFGKVGLGSQVSEMLEFAPLEYDDAEELFYSNGLKGLELGGSNACDLTTNPSQIITSVRIF
ncbi:hypothetical protein [Rhizobium sp. BR 314]|uniref:hypothetical protein n=1 Tax=Rhizobium sp. BR 314 TaxID=3040013 RepID=UPI0039BF0812